MRRCHFHRSGRSEEMALASRQRKMVFGEQFCLGRQKRARAEGHEPVNLMHKLAARAEAGRPVRAGLIGAGKFGSMFLVPGPDDCRAGGRRDRRPRSRPGARGLPDAWAGTSSGSPGRASSTPGSMPVRGDGVEVVIEATGSPVAGITPCAGGDRGRQAHRHGQCRGRRAGRAALAAKARERGVVYSMAYGDQPALVAEMVDWARAAGFTVAAAGKGTKYLPPITRSRRTTSGRITA